MNGQLPPFYVLHRHFKSPSCFSPESCFGPESNKLEAINGQCCCYSWGCAPADFILCADLIAVGAVISERNISLIHVFH